MQYGKEYPTFIIAIVLAIIGAFLVIVGIHYKIPLLLIITIPSFIILWVFFVMIMGSKYYRKKIVKGVRKAFR